MQAVWQRLRERKLVQWALAYLAGAWLLFQVASLVGQTFGWPRTLLRIFVALLAVGFVGALILAWYHGEKGRQRASGPELVMMAALLVIAGPAVWFVRGGAGSHPPEAARSDLAAPRGVATGEDAAEQGSIAVLPFVNMSGNEADEYFSDGMTEELINALTAVGGLRVAARTSSFAFKGKEADVREIGQSLNVQTILEGSVRKARNRLRITAQLVNVADGYHLWSETYDREMEDVFAVQEEISRAIVSALKVKLAAAEERPVATRTGHLEAYDLYLKGRYFWNKRTEEGLKTAIEYFERAIALDRSYAPPYAGLADSYIVLSIGHGFLSPEEGMPRGKEAAMKALELDEALAEAHASLAHVKTWYERDWAGAEREYKRAIELDPNYATAHHWYSLLLVGMGRFEEGFAEIRRAHELEPYSLIIATTVGRRVHFGRRYDEAIAAYRSALELDPNFAIAHKWLGIAYAQQGSFADALEELRKATELEPKNTVIRAALAYGYALSGSGAEARKILEGLKAGRRYVSPYRVAIVYAALGETDQAFEWLEKGYRERDGWLLNLNVDPALDPLRSDPRFARLVKRMGLPPYRIG